MALDSSDASRRHQPRPQGTTGEGDVVSGHIRGMKETTFHGGSRGRRLG